MGRFIKFLRNLFSCHKKSKNNLKHEQADCASLPTILTAVDFDLQSDNDVAISSNKCSASSNNNLHGSSDQIVTDNDGSQICLEALLETVVGLTDAGNTNSCSQQLEQPITNDKSQNDGIQYNTDVIYESDEEETDGDPKTENYAVVDQKFITSIRELLVNTSRQPEGDGSFNNKNYEELDSTPEEGESEGSSNDEPIIFPSILDDKTTSNNNEEDYSRFDSNGSDRWSCLESNEGGSDGWDDSSDWYTLSQREFESWHGVECNQITSHSNISLSTIAEESEPDEDLADERGSDDLKEESEWCTVFSL